MAGDWIKIENILPQKPEVFRMAEILKIDPDEVVGKLVRFWIWADQQLVDGDDLQVSEAFFSQFFAKKISKKFFFALRSVHWLEEKNGRFFLPNFARHNTRNAKNRALSGDRKKKERESCHANVVEMSRSERDKSVTREEKRREENINTKKISTNVDIKESSANASPVVVNSPDPDLENLQAKIAAKKQPTPKFDPRTLPLHESLTGCEAAWSAWCDHRDEIKKPITPTAARQLLAKGQQMGAQRFKAAIRHSAANGWQGLFEPQDANGPTPSRPPPLSAAQRREKFFDDILDNLERQKQNDERADDQTFEVDFFRLEN